MRGPTFEIYSTLRLLRSTQWRWRLVASNGEIVGQGEPYSSEYSAIRACRRIRAIAGNADIVNEAGETV